MKRILMLALAATALSFPAAVTAAKPVDSVKGPACNDIDLSVDYTYDTPGAQSGSATASGTITTAGAVPSCKKGAYTVYVYDASGTNRLASCSYSGDGVATQFAPCTYTSTAGDPLCVYATSESNGRVMDSAPNEGCAAFGEPITPGPSGATSFH
jgi:hypothetical protein